MLLHGIFPPITTPFYPDGRVYLKKLEHNESVDGQVVMWAALLRETSMFESKILEFGDVTSNGVLRTPLTCIVSIELAKWLVT